MELVKHEFAFFPLWEVLSNQKCRYYATNEGQMCIEGKVFTKQVLTGRKSKIITFKYYSEITSKMGKERRWFFNMYYGGEQFIANHLLHWFKPFIFFAKCFTTDFEFCSFVLLSNSANA